MSQLPDKQHDSNDVGAERTVLSQAIWNGPLPPPAVLKQYDEVNTGLAERIVASMEREQSHRHDMDRSLLSAHRSLYARGQFIAAFVVVTCLILGFLLGYNGQTTAAVAFVTGGVSQVILAFLGIRQERPKEEK